jgi:Cu/Ag efflux protein CusF
VIVEILTAKSALLVKHDEIPGVMSAMTMLLKVDAPPLAAAKKGQSITATLIKKTNGWWLETVTPLAAP